MIIDLSQVPPTRSTIQFNETDKVNVIEIVFNRAVTDEGIKPHNQPQSITVTPQEGTVAGDLQFTNTNNNVVRFIAIDSSPFPGFSTYTLTVSGSTEPAIRAQNDGALLDGDFDGQPGGDYVLFFEVFGLIS